MSNIKLQNILFEQKLPPKKLTKFAAPEYSLLPISNLGARSRGLVLVHTSTFLFYASNTRVPKERLSANDNEWLCAMAKTSHMHNGSCSNAVEINYAAANPKFPGAGSTIYACMSKYLGKPITSDRAASTSDSAKKAWAKIENSPEWKRTTLDGYMDAQTRTKKNADGYEEPVYEPVYFDAEGSWPQRTITPRNGPKTPQTSDDCTAPEDAIGEWDELDRTLGSADAWLYTGNIDVKGMLDHGNRVKMLVRAKTGWDFAELVDVAQNFFGNRYEEANG